MSTAECPDHGVALEHRTGDDRTANASGRCPQCPQQRRCWDCGVADLGTWMSGVCGGCYRKREVAWREEDARRAADLRRHERADAWDAGYIACAQDIERDAVPAMFVEDAANPYRVDAQNVAGGAS